MSFESIDQQTLGERLRIARANAGLNQEQASQNIGLSRTTLVAIEQGQRRIRPTEIRQLADLYNVSVNDLVRIEAVHVDLAPRFRKAVEREGSTNAAQEAAALLIRLSKSVAELYRRVGATSIEAYPQEFRLLPGDLEQQAEELALNLRHRLGLGLAPIADIVSLLENELGIRVFLRPLNSSVSGAFVYDVSVGACILVNSKHSPERQVLTLIHELGHFMCARSSADIVDHTASDSREERFVVFFSMAFLAPAAAVRKRFAEVTAGTQSFTVRHLLLLAHQYGFSFEGMTRRLEHLSLIPEGTFELLKRRGLSVERLKVLCGLPASAAVCARPPQSTLLAIEAYRKGIFSEGQLCEMLALDRVQIRELLDSFGGEEMDYEISLPA